MSKYQLVRWEDKTGQLCKQGSCLLGFGVFLLVVAWFPWSLLYYSHAGLLTCTMLRALCFHKIMNVVIIIDSPFTNSTDQNIGHIASGSHHLWLRPRAIWQSRSGSALGQYGNLGKIFSHVPSEHGNMTCNVGSTILETAPGETIWTWLICDEMNQFAWL